MYTKYLLKGRVVRGEGWGSRIGYPTANLDKRYFNQHPLPSGVYACWVTLYNGKEIKDVKGGRMVKEGQRMSGLAVIGVGRFFIRGSKVEVYILNFNKNIVGLKLECELVKKLRPLKKFDHTDNMIKQIKRDIREARRVLKSNI